MNYQQIKALYDAKGYVFHKERHRVNLFGRRNKDIVTVDQFNDMLGGAYLDGFGTEQCLEFAGTTKPGLTPITNGVANPKGVFIMAPGQHLDCWIVGFHHINDPDKKYEAYQQKAAGVFKGWRDGDKDGKFDMTGPIYTDAQGVNGHHAGEESVKVGGWSEGCQVVQITGQHLTWMSIGKTSAKFHGNSFHYTLFQL